MIERTGSHRKAKETGLYLTYKCKPADRQFKQATCVSGKWTPEIQCTGMILDLHIISSFFCRHGKCLLLKILSLTVPLICNRNAYILVCVCVCICIKLHSHLN